MRKVGPPCSCRAQGRSVHHGPAGRRARRAQRAALLLAAALALGGCATATAVKDKVVEVATTAGTYLSEQAAAAADFVMGRRSGSLVDDGTTCFKTERVAFYGAVDEVTQAQRLALGAKAATAVAAIVAIYADSIVAKLLALGFAATMVAVIVDIETDRTRINAVSDTFDALIACRRRDAKQINADYAKRQLDRPAAEAQLAQLRSLVAEDVEVARGTNAILVARNEGFVLSARQVEEQAPPPKDAKETNERKRQTKEVSAALQTNQKALAQQTARIDQAQALADSGGGFSLSQWRGRLLLLADLVAG